MVNRKRTFLIVFMLLFPWSGSLFGGQCPREMSPMNPDLHKCMVQAEKLMDRGRTTQALTLLDRYARENPSEKHPYAVFVRGLLNYRLKRLKKAEALFKTAVDLNPCLVEARQNLAVVYHEQKRPAKAARSMEQVLALSKGEQPELKHQAALCWLAAGKPGKALPLLRALSRNPNPPEGARRTYIKTLVSVGKLHQAEPLLRSLLKEKPEDPGIWLLAAWIYMERKDYPRAAAALHVAYRLNPPNPGEWKRLGDLYRLSGVPMKAVDAYEKAFGPSPGARDLDLLAETYIAANRMEKALAAAERAVRLKPTAKRWARVGDLCLKRRDCCKAKSAFQQAARIDDRGGLMSLKEGYAAWQMQEMACAKNAFQKALRHAEPKSDTALKASHALAAIRQITDAAQN